MRYNKNKVKTCRGRKNMSESTAPLNTTPAPQPAAPLPPYQRPLTPTELEAQQPRSFFMVIAVFLLSVMFSETVLLGTFSGISMTVCIVLFYTAAICYLRGRSNAFSKGSVLMLLPIALLSASYVFDNGTLAWFVTTAFLALLIPLQLTAMSGAGTRSVFSSRILSDTAAMMFAKLFGNLDTPFMTFSAVKRKSSTAKIILKLLLGAAIAVPFLLIFIALFASADSIFESYLITIADAFHFNFFSCAFTLITGGLITLFASAFLLGLRSVNLPEKEAAHTQGKLNPLVTSVFLLLIILLQASFITVQCVYLFGGHTLPEGMTYAGYARSGFFQISTASVITALLILFISFFGKRGKNGALMLQTKILLSVLTCCDLFLYYCAYVKMGAYIQAYDLTVRRIGVCWLMAVMALILAGVLLHMWLPKLNLTAWVLTCLCVSVIALNICSPDRLSAKYNIDQYLNADQSTAHIDTDYLGRLAPSVILELDRLKGTPEEDNAKIAMRNAAERLEQHTWKGLCVTDGKAYEIAKSWGVIYPEEARAE